MKSLIITVDRNTPGKRDFSGAFKPESWACARAWGVPRKEIVYVDIGASLPKRRQQVLSAIEAAGPELEIIAFLCHGLRTKLPQLGWNRMNLGPLARTIAAASTTNVRVVLYACSAGEGPRREGDGGFADHLRDALCVAGAVDCQVDAHERAAHTTENPYVRRFEGLGSPAGGAGGAWIVTPKSSPWTAWREALDGPMRFSFPKLRTSAVLAAI